MSILIETDSALSYFQFISIRNLQKRQFCQLFVLRENSIILVYDTLWDLSMKYVINIGQFYDSINGSLTLVLMQTFKEFFDKVIDEIHHFDPNEIQPQVDFSVTKVL